jgi:hypothetical protein
VVREVETSHAVKGCRLLRPAELCSHCVGS